MATPLTPQNVNPRTATGSVWCCLCQVYTFGCNDHLALGRDAGQDECMCFYPLYVQLGCIVIAQVSAGDSHTAVLSREGRVYIWGAFRVCTCSDVNKDFSHNDKDLWIKDQDKDKDFTKITVKDKDKDEDLTVKDKDKDQDLTVKIRAITAFKVIQGHRGRYQSKACMRLPISDE